MATREQCAQMSGAVYDRTDENSMFAPNGWTEQIWLPDDAITGFSAGVYFNGTEVVVAFTGTNEGQVADFVFGNIPAALELSGPAGPPAAAVVFDVMDYVQRNDLDVAISFTGAFAGGRVGIGDGGPVRSNRRSSLIRRHSRTSREPLSLLGMLRALIDRGQSAIRR